MDDYDRALRWASLGSYVAISVLIYRYRHWIKRLAGWGYLGIFLASLLGNATLLLPAPVLALALVEGKYLNPYGVGGASAAGATLGELTGYLAGYGGQAFVDHEQYPQLQQWLDDYGFAAIVTLAAVPNPVFDVVGILAGLNHYPLHLFVAATFLGKLVKFTAVALFGKAVL
jgi:membrane protein YqaA with SNARE-associated domain